VKLKKPLVVDKDWFEITSELFVNVAAAWFAIVLIEPQFDKALSLLDILWLILKLVAGIISMYIAKYFRKISRRRYGF